MATGPRPVQFLYRALVPLVCLVVLTLSAPQPVEATAQSGTATLAVRCGDSTVNLDADWYFPRTYRALGLVWLQHGFARQNDQMADLARQLANRGLVVVAPTINSFDPTCNFNNIFTFLPGFAPLFAGLGDPAGALQRSADAAAAQANLPRRPLPSVFAFAGHSAGGAAVTFVAADLAVRFPAAARNLKGLMLFDPVESVFGVMGFSLPALRDITILTLSAPPCACNARASGTRALAATGRPFIGAELVSGSHCDAEGASSDGLCALVCGASKPENVRVLHLLSGAWTRDLFDARRNQSLYPGGLIYGALLSGGVIRTLP